MCTQTIGSVAKSEDYAKVLDGPLYTLIRKALYPPTDNTDINVQASERAPFKGNVHEIEEEEEDKSVSSFSEEDENVNGKSQSNDGETLFCLSPEVKQALGTLERVISMVRKSKKYDNTSTSSEEEEGSSSSSLSPSPKQYSESTAAVSSSKVCKDPKTDVLDEASLTHYHNQNNNNNNR